MSYEAIVCRLTGVRPHSNADRLKVADAAGCQVIVGADRVDGDLGIVFPEGGTICREFCLANGLYRKHPDTLEPILGGYLDENGRVRALKLRGEVSFGLWLPIEALLAVLKRDDRPWQEGDTVGAPFCEKYLTPATRAAMRQGAPRKARAESALPRHYDTPQFRDLHALPLCDLVVITEKVHGTSGRTGLVEVEQPRPWWRRLFGLKAKKRWEYVSGTRNCVLADGGEGEKGQEYRRIVHDRMTEAHEFERGEVWYYEIAGFDTRGTAIMAAHTVGSIGDDKLEKQLRREYGDRITYDYGCRQQTQDHRVFVYRITQDGRELPFEEVRRRAHSAGFETPVVLAWLHDPESIEQVRAHADALSRGSSFYSAEHPREGVCVRFEDSTSGNVSRAWKHKGFVFCALEGIARNDKDYVDTEEAA